MGILHVEQGTLVVIRQLITGTGLEYAWAEFKCKSNPMFKYMYNIL